MIYCAEAKKDKKPKDKRPLSVEPELYCNGCQAIVRETLKKLKDQTSESDVFMSLENICDFKNLYVYEYPPPEMKKGCLAFIEGWQEIIEKELIKRKNNDEVEEKICKTITKACEGVDPSAKRKQQNAPKNEGGPKGIKLEPNQGKSKVIIGSEKIEL